MRGRAQAAEQNLTTSKAEMAAAARTDAAHEAVLLRHIDELRAREARVEGPPERVLRNLIDVLSALALAEANLEQWRTKDAPARARRREETLATYTGERNKSTAALDRGQAAIAVAKLANGALLPLVPSS